MIAVMDGQDVQDVNMSRAVIQNDNDKRESGTNSSGNI